LATSSNPKDFFWPRLTLDVRLVRSLQLSWLDYGTRSYRSCGVELSPMARPQPHRSICRIRISSIGCTVAKVGHVYVVTARSRWSGKASLSARRTTARAAKPEAQEKLITHLRSHFTHSSSASHQYLYVVMPIIIFLETYNMLSAPKSACACSGRPSRRRLVRMRVIRKKL
jgi:hypothetical protein